ncbi:MAG: hypothetical protein H0A75_00430 [Candidatus Methanofishera endochildressiae]|uniref:Uncharacterized protein n=1 Tax=Candidatus Methanofishera endochildressiae TaxID=2738884 RepID=A0A7Z0MMF4_9GAMM|nr:hypothetical protein [Candidatus Methanofishera endochildressiae]
MLTIQRWSSFTIICLLAIAPVQAKINFSANPIGQGNIEINELGFRLTPLTQDELLPAADHWQALLQTQLVEISELNINIAKADKAQKEALLEQLQKQKEQKNKTYRSWRI